MRKATNLAHSENASENTIRNRKRTLRERYVRIINNSSLPGHEKVFIKGQMKSIFDELELIVMVHERKRFKNL